MLNDRMSKSIAGVNVIHSIETEGFDTVVIERIEVDLNDERRSLYFQRDEDGNWCDLMTKEDFDEVVG